MVVQSDYVGGIIENMVRVRESRIVTIQSCPCVVRMDVMGSRTIV